MKKQLLLLNCAAFYFLTLVFVLASIGSKDWKSDGERKYYGLFLQCPMKGDGSCIDLDSNAMMRSARNMIVIHITGTIYLFAYCFSYAILLYRNKTQAYLSDDQFSVLNLLSVLVAFFAHWAGFIGIILASFAFHDMNPEDETGSGIALYWVSIPFSMIAWVLFTITPAIARSRSYSLKAREGVAKKDKKREQQQLKDVASGVDNEVSPDDAEVTTCEQQREEDLEANSTRSVDGSHQTSTESASVTDIKIEELS